jgi:hypothetical protein
MVAQVEPMALYSVQILYSAMGSTGVRELLHSCLLGKPPADPSQAGPVGERRALVRWLGWRPSCSSGVVSCSLPCLVGWVLESRLYLLLEDGPSRVALGQAEDALVFRACQLQSPERECREVSLGQEGVLPGRG